MLIDLHELIFVPRSCYCFCHTITDILCQLHSELYASTAGYFDFISIL